MGSVGRKIYNNCNNSQDGLNSTLDTTKEKTGKLEDRKIENIQGEAHKKKNRTSLPCGTILNSLTYTCT